MICGCLSAHTGEEDDFVQITDNKIKLEDNIEHTSLSQLQLFNIPLKRKSCDVHKGCGNYGQARLEMCSNISICILNGRCGNDISIGKVIRTDNSVIDYMIGSPFILSKVSYFTVHHFDQLLPNKHCLVEIILNVTSLTESHGNIILDQNLTTTQTEDGTLISK